MVSFVVNTRLTFVSPSPTSAIPLFRTLSETQFPLSPLSPIACRLLNSLASLFRAPVLCFQCFAASFSKTPGVGVSPSLNRGSKMTDKSPSSDFTPGRCQYRTATGRQCCSLAIDPDSSFCARSLRPRTHLASPRQYARLYQQPASPLANRHRQRSLSQSRPPRLRRTRRSHTAK